MPDWLQFTLQVAAIGLLALAGLMLLYSGLFRPIINDVRAIDSADIHSKLPGPLRPWLDINAKLSATLGATAVAIVVAIALSPFSPLGAILFGAVAVVLLIVRLIAVMLIARVTVTGVIGGEIGPNKAGAAVVFLAGAGASLLALIT